MDVGAFVQENKKWLLGVGCGAVSWFLVSAIFDSVHAVQVPTERSLGAPTGPVYTQAALDAARAEGEELAKARAALVKALQYAPSATFQLPDGVRPGDFLFQQSRDLKQRILASANQRDVQVADGAIAWEVPTGVDEIRATLFGLDLIDAVQARLYGAHDATRATDETAVGLRSIVSLKLDARRSQRAPMRAQRPGEIDVRDFFTQEQLSFQFQSDERTALTFLEALGGAKPDSQIVLESWQMLKPARPGEACAIKGTAIGLAFKPRTDATEGM
ncbi:MAG: hypothetical protein FJ301_01105 [Planctomycetes bacterium]|nr:hypothetical protein [Planctomycetota bacterium]